MQGMKQRNWLTLTAGVLIGSVFSSFTAQAAQSLQVSFSNQKFYVDGEQTALEAYNINGNNYVKLGDLSKLVGFDLSYDSKTNSVYIGEQPAQNDVVVIPQSDARLNLKEGDKVLCDDGYIYEITDMKRYDKSMFASGPLPALPTPTCDWSVFPELELPKAEVRHFKDETGDSMFIRNLHEIRRMQYTLYNLIGSSPDAWNGGNPLAQVRLGIENENGVGRFWPWRESEIANLYQSTPRSRFTVDAFDYYENGVYQHTRYCITTR